MRELYEVFLLLDHISGRWDKELRGQGSAPHEVIRTICEIGLAPAADPAVRLQQAVDLMCAKDMLNAVARPATVTGARYNQVSNEFWNAAHDTLSGRAQAPAALKKLDGALNRFGRGGRWK